MRILRHERARDGWLRWPCDCCGGVRLPVLGGDRFERPDTPVSRPVVALDVLCPRCEAERRRFETAGADPAVWYETSLRDWVVRLPCPGLEHGALLPLEIGWFDADWAEVYRAASDLAHSGAELGDFIAGAPPGPAQSTIHLHLPDD